MRSCWGGSEKSQGPGGREDSAAGGQEKNRGGGAGLGKPCGLCTGCAALLRDVWQQLAVPSGAWPARALPNWPRTFVHLSLLFHPLVTSTPLHLSHSATTCFSKPCSGPAPLASLLASAPGTDLLGTPLDFQGASPLHYCYVLSGFIINFTYSGLSVPLVPYLIMDILILASEAHVTMGTKFAFNGLIAQIYTLTKHWRKSSKLV